MVCITPFLSVRVERRSREMLSPHVTYLGPAHPDASCPAIMRELRTAATPRGHADDIHGARVIPLARPASDDASPTRFAAGGAWGHRLPDAGWSLQGVRAA
jgi:hypothetical protein